MNLPTEINFGPNHKILYLYDANGRKLKKQVIHNAQSHHTDYSGAFQYEDGFLTLILTPEGRIVKHSSTYDPQYFLKDYLGNVRVVYHANPETGMVEVVQEDHYDPFGMKLGGLGYVSDIENKYLFQGKEFNDEAIDTDSDGNTDTYMNWYDFEARQFDPQIARWHVADPVAQYPSPYVGMGNNPVSLVDPNGMATMWSLEESYYYRAYYSDFTDHGGRLGSEREIYTRIDPSTALEQQALMEQGQMSADGVYGGGSNSIAATHWGSGNNTGDEGIIKYIVDECLNQIRKENNKPNDPNNPSPKSGKNVEQYKIDSQKYPFLIKASERIFALVMEELTTDINGNPWQERSAYQLNSSDKYLILPSYKSKVNEVEWSCQLVYQKEVPIKVVGSDVLCIYKFIEYKISAVYHTHPFKPIATPNKANYYGVKKSGDYPENNSYWEYVSRYIIYQGRVIHPPYWQGGP